MKSRSLQLRDDRLIYVLMLAVLLWLPLSSLLTHTGLPSNLFQPGEQRSSIPSAALSQADTKQVTAGIEQAVYQFNWNSRQSVYTAPNPAQGYQVRMTGVGVEVVSTLPRNWTWQLRLSAWGYGAARQPVQVVNAPGQLGGDYDRFEYQYPGLTEWYRNGPAGLEHGFTIPERPVESLLEDDILTFELAYTGTYVPRLSAGGQRLDFLTPDGGEVRLQYDQLKVWDASGVVLPAWLQTLPSPNTNETLIYLQVDTDGAQYPLVIDPHLTTLSAMLQATDGTAYDHYGFAVDVSGDAAIIGSPGPVSIDPDAPDPSSSADKAYIHYRNQSGADQWGQVVKLAASGLDTLQMFGFSVAICDDIAAVGAPRYDVSGQQNQGLVYIFYRNQGGMDNWGQVAQVTAADGRSGDKFGWDIALKNDLLVVGSPNLDDNGTNNIGAVYLFRRNAGGEDAWGQIGRLTASDPSVNDRFGYAVDVDGDHILVGAPYKPTEGTAVNQFQGAAYMFRYDPNDPQKFTQVRKLTAADGDRDDYFGWSVAVDHDHAVIGAPGRISQQGAAYVFERNIGGVENWGQVKLLVPADPSNGAQFGDEVDLEEATIVVGAYTKTVTGLFGGGAVYIFERNQGGADQWGQVSRLVNTAGAASNDYFGRGIGIDSSNLVIGTDGMDVSGQVDQGAAFGYYRTGTTWELAAIPTANDGAAGDQLGCDLAVNPETLVVGACRDNSDQGAVYVFYRNTGGVESWGQVRKLTAGDGAAGDLFGSSVALLNDKILVGAPGDNAARGGAYLFYRNQGSGDNWGQFQKITASDGVSGDRFGADVSLDVYQAAVGAPEKNGGEGGGYVFYRADLLASPWQQQRILSVGGAGGFGTSLSIFGEKLLVGAPDSNTAQGRAYIYYRNEGGVDQWGLKKTLTASNGGAGDRFGAAVDLFVGRAVIGAPGRSSNTGAFYLFGQNTGGVDNWGQTLTRAGSISGARYGAAVDLDGDLLAVGAPGGNTAYTYKRNLSGGDAWGLFQALTGATGEDFGRAVSVLEDSLAVAAPLANSGRGQGYVYLLTEFFQDVAILKTVSPARVAPGDAITFVLDFANQGEGEATSVVIEDILPAVLTNVQVSTSGYPVQPGSAAGTWVTDSLPMGENGTITITAVIDASAISGTYNNEATISAVEPEIYYDNNTSSVNFEIDAEGPLPPQLVYPANGAVITLNSDVLLQWQASPSPDVASYRVHFNGLVLPVVGQTLMLNNVLDGVYSWYVTGVDDLGNEGVPSSTWSFELDTGLTENRPPRADAGPDQVVLPGSQVTLDGTSSSDPDGHTPLSFHWTQISGPAVAFDEIQPVVTFTAPDAPGTLVFELVVTDLFGLASPPDRVAVVVSESGRFESYLPAMQNGSTR